MIQKQQNKEEHGLDTDGMEIPLSGQVDYTLNECALITQHCENYFRWLIQQGKVLCMDEMAEQSDSKSNWEGQNQASYNLDGDNLDSDSDVHSVSSEEDPDSADAAKALVEKEASDLANKYGLTRESLGEICDEQSAAGIGVILCPTRSRFHGKQCQRFVSTKHGCYTTDVSIEPDTGNIIKEEGRKQEFLLPQQWKKVFLSFKIVHYVP